MTQSFGYLVTFAPLVSNQIGRSVSEIHSIPPFVDGSIRREPDFLHSRPGISCLCRGGSFAPRLCVGDVVVYLTKKSKYGRKVHCNRLIAVLRVTDVFGTHAEASAWYQTNNLPLPNNCVVPGNAATPLSMSHRIHGFGSAMEDKRVAAIWDGAYRLRAKKHPTFVVCETVHKDLSWTSKQVLEQNWIDVFGRIPGTLNPAALSLDRINDLLTNLGMSERV